MNEVKWINSGKYGNVEFNFTLEPIEDLAIYAEGYWEAGKAVFEKIFSLNGYGDNDCYPIFFLYRHSLELYLKAVLYKGAKLLKLINEQNININCIYKSHNLKILIPGIKSIFKERNWLKGDGLNDFMKIETLVNNLNDLDTNSISFRYPTNKQGNSPFEHHTLLNVNLFSELANEVLSLLDGAVTGLDVDWDYSAAIMHEIKEILENPDINPYKQ